MAVAAPGPFTLVAVFAAQLGLLGGWNWYSGSPSPPVGGTELQEEEPEILCAACAPCPPPRPCQRASRRSRTTSTQRSAAVPVVVGWSSGCLLNTAVVAFLAGICLACFVCCSCPWLPAALAVAGVALGLSRDTQTQRIAPYAIEGVPGDSGSE